MRNAELQEKIEPLKVMLVVQQKTAIELDTLLPSILDRAFKGGF